MDSSASLRDFLGLVGVRVGSYVVREIASLGGVALIYRGEHETLHNAVAVKVLTPEVASGEVRDTLEQLFLREAQILSQLRSEHILRAHHHGRVVCPADNRERPYMVVDWLEGQPLADEIDSRRRAEPRRPYTMAEAVELLEPIALALDTAHAAGIIHRDVNPRNIFLETAGSEQRPRAKLIDFGFAKDVAQTRNLQLGRVQGTLFARSPDYAAPEHYDREKYGELSENTDIYTFALTFVEMLTLESPLRGATNEALALATSNPNDRPTPNNRGANVPYNVEQLFAQALAVDQFERPGSLLGWFRDLQQALRRPTTAPPRRSLPVKKRKRSLVWPILLVLLVLAAGAGGAVFWLMRPLECPAGHADCNGVRGDGCEVELASNAAHCGGCANACPTKDGAALCAGGVCRIERCLEETRKDCNGNAADGCEVDTTSDLNNCGACNKRCGKQGTTEASCREARCELSCSKDRGDCDDLPDNGCEAELASDSKNCGACGLGCRATRCEGGFCAPKQLASVETPVLLSALGGETFVASGSDGKLSRISANGQQTTLVPTIKELSALLATRQRVFWVAGDPAARVFELVPGTEPASAKPVAEPLAGPTPLVLSADGAYLSWADRSPRGKPIPAPLAKRTLLTLELASDAAKPREVKCPDYPARFVGDDRHVFCCDDAKPLTVITCPEGKCGARRLQLLCPELLVLDAEQLYFFRGTRLYALDRNGSQPRQLTKRVRRPRELVQDATHVYWIEGDQDSAIVRQRKPEGAKTAPDPPEVIAGKLKNARSLAIDEGAIYWAAAAADAAKAELLALQKPSSALRQSPKKPKD